MLHWKERTKLCKGGSKSGGGGGGASSSNTQTTDSQPKLPDGVEAYSFDGTTSYEFKVAGVPIELSISRGASGSSYVDFMVGGDFDNNSRLSPRQGAVVFAKLGKIMKHDASTRPDGFKYETTAWTGDGMGATRAMAYMKAGFSRPISGDAGDYQYAVVKNGKLVPDKARVKKENRAMGMTASEILANLRYLKDERQRERLMGPSPDGLFS